MEGFNNKIKEVLLKEFHKSFFSPGLIKHLNKCLIEICELQKQECAKQFNFEGTHYKILNTKNIAENE